LSLDGVETNDPDAFMAALETVPPETGVQAVVRRDTIVFETELTPEPLPETSAPRELYRVDPVRTRAGYRTEVLEVSGAPRATAVVAKLFPESPVDEGMLEVGDAVVALDGDALASAQDLVTRLIEERGPGDQVALTVLRDSEVIEISVCLWEPERELTKLAILPLFQYTHEVEASRTDFTLIDLWIVSLFHYRRDEGESEYRILSLLRFGTGRGELTEELPEPEDAP
jgi:S1-C subfamily serine protease